MGASASKQSRKLPKTVDTISKITKNSTIKVTDHKLNLSNEKIVPINKLSSVNEKPQINTNKNVDNIGIIKTEEIPIKLDQNNPVIKTLQNRKALEELFKKSRESTDVQSQQTSVSPADFCSIINDLQIYKPDQISKTFKISENFINILKESGVKISSEKYEVDPEKMRDPSTIKSSKNGWDKEDYVYHRINGIPTPNKSKLESSLEQMMNPNA